MTQLSQLSQLLRVSVFRKKTRVRSPYWTVPPLGLANFRELPQNPRASSESLEQADIAQLVEQRIRNA